MQRQVNKMEQIILDFYNHKIDDILDVRLNVVNFKEYVENRKKTS